MKETGLLPKKKSQEPSWETLNVAATVESVFGCKWSLRILALIRQGVCRPGAIERALPGLTPKVQTYYFRRMMEMGLLERVVYPEIPPRVEYHLTAFGLRFMPILDSIAELQREMEAAPPDGSDAQRLINRDQANRV